MKYRVKSINTHDKYEVDVKENKRYKVGDIIEVWSYRFEIIFIY